MLTFKQAVMLTMVHKINNYKDRATRSEYWWFALFYIMVSCALSLLRIIPVIGPLTSFVIGCIMLGSVLSVQARRLHDLNKSAWLMALPAAMLLAAIIVSVVVAVSDFGGDLANYLIWALMGLTLASFMYLMVLNMLPGTAGPNRFGDDPLATGYSYDDSQVFASWSNFRQAMNGKPVGQDAAQPAPQSQTAAQNTAPDAPLSQAADNTRAQVAAAASQAASQLQAGLSGITDKFAMGSKAAQKDVEAALNKGQQSQDQAPSTQDTASRH